MSERCIYSPPKPTKVIIKVIFNYTGKENGRNNKIWKLESKQTDRKFLVGLKMFSPKLEVGKMEKNT